MTRSNKANELIAQLSGELIKLGDIKKLAKQVKKNHKLALELWSTKLHHPRLLATLIFDKTLLTQSTIDQLAMDLIDTPKVQRNQIADWLLANQFMKDKKIISLMLEWKNSQSAILERLYWYYQARLRWAGQTPPNDSAQLLDVIEMKIENAEPGVQWTMNFCAAQIGVNEPELRARCVTLGEKLGLYKDEHVSKNCTPSYLPEFIRIEVAKRELK